MHGNPFLIFLDLETDMNDLIAMVPRALREYPCKFAVRMAQLIPAFRAYNVDLVPEVWGFKVNINIFGVSSFSKQFQHQTNCFCSLGVPLMLPSTG